MVVVVITARPSYARVKTVLEALQKRLTVTVVLAASALLERYGRVADVVHADGFTTLEVPAVVEGSTLLSGVLTTAHLADALGRLFADLSPQLVVTVADRRETLATAIAARYQHIPLMHLLAGETSGSVDNDVRAAVSCLAQYHAVATHAAYEEGVLWQSVKVTGCPSIDLAKRALGTPPVTCEELGGTGSLIDLASRRFLILLQHPTTDHVTAAAEEMETTMAALTGLDRPVVALWPGEESGSDASAKVMRQLKEHYLGNHAWHFVRNLPPERFYRLLDQSACVVGNSSVGLRECAYLGVPCVNVGTRQQGRERADNVRDVPFDVQLIRQAVQQATLPVPRPARSLLYGDGTAGEKVAQWIQEIVG